MKYTHYLYKLSSGHTIVTPHGKEITREEYREYFEISSQWLKDVRPNAYKDIKPDPDNQKTYGSMINKMFDAYLYDPVEGGVQANYFLDKRTLAFLFVVSYLIQKEDRECITPFLSHVMGNALLLWLPIKDLVEHYLSLSAEVGKGSNLLDAFLLVRLFCPNIGFTNYGFEKDVDKALKYATVLYNNPLNKHRVENYDYAYARALFEKNKCNAKECIEIIDKKLNKFNIEREDYTNVLLNYLILELEIASKVRDIKVNLDLNYIEELLSKQGDYSMRKNQGYYWLAQCYINGKNNAKDISKAIKLLTSINDPYLYKKAGAALANLYLTGNGVEYDAREALDIAYMAEEQANLHPYTRDHDKQLINIQESAFAKVSQEKYIGFLRKILNTPIHFVNIEAIETFLKFHLLDEEYNYLINEYTPNDDQSELFKRIVRKLRHPVIRRELNGACNKMIYVGTDDNGYDSYFNFEECGNMFIHGTCGAGKTWLLYSIFKRLKDKECYKKTNMAFWSFKPFEFEGWCDDYLIKNPHDFIKKIQELSKTNDNQTLVFIDEFEDLIWSISDKEKEKLLDAFKHSKTRNINFICCSQHMNNALEMFGEYVSTRICMMCYQKEESISMIDSDVAATIGEYGNMYIKNSNVNGFLKPKKMKVVKI